jgi:tetratricopeptide (TPR) repeat protein
VTKAEALAQIAFWAAKTGRPDAAELTEELLLLIDRLGLEHLRPAALMTLGLIRFPSTVEYQAAIVGAEKIGSGRVVEASINLAATWFLLGDLAGAWSAQAEARRDAERFGKPHAVRHLESELVLEEYLRGDWASAERRATWFIDSSLMSPHFMEAPCRVVRGEIRVGRGDLAGALDDAERALAVGVGLGLEYEREARAFAASVAVAAGRIDEAEAHLEAGLKLWGASAAFAPSWDAMRLAFASVALDDPERLLSVVQTGLQTPWVAAARTFASGDPVGAAEELDRIGSVSDAMYARLKAADPVVLEEALGFYRTVEATAHVAEAEQRLAALRSVG